MAATFDCLPSVQACRLRVARLDGAGVPQPGANNMVVYDGMSKLTLTPVYTEADEIKEKNACGTVTINFKGQPSFDRCDWELEMLTWDAAVYELLTNGDAVAGTSRYGINAPPIGDVSATNYFSIEVWARRINNGVIDTSFPYARWVIPGCKYPKVGAIPFENAAQKWTVTGEAYENTNWYNGPVNDWTVASDRVFQMQPVATLPSAVCGYQTVSAT